MWVLDLHKLYHVCRAVGRTVPQKCDGVLPPGISVGDGIVFTRAEHGPGSIILRVPLPCGPILGPLFSRYYQKPLEGCAGNSHCIIKINFLEAYITFHLVIGSLEYSLYHFILISKYTTNTSSCSCQYKKNARLFCRLLILICINILDDLKNIKHVLCINFTYMKQFASQFGRIIWHLIKIDIVTAYP